MVCDADMRIIAFNEKFSELHDHRPGDLRLGMAYEDFLRLAFARGNIQTDNIEEFIAQRLKSAYSREYLPQRISGPEWPPYHLAPHADARRRIRHDDRRHHRP